jgi:hypothetical protein
MTEFSILDCVIFDWPRRGDLIAADRFGSAFRRKNYGLRGIESCTRIQIQSPD